MDPDTTMEMRHVPPLSEIVERVDVRLRAIATIVAASIEARKAASPADAAAAQELLTAVVRWLDRLADHNRHVRRAVNSPEAPISVRLQIAFDNAVAALRGIDDKAFRRRASLHLFDKSHAEGVFGCVLAAGESIYRAAEAASRFDPDLYGTIYAKTLCSAEMPELRLVGATPEAGG